jgi:penicillin-binding protein 2
VGRDNRGVERIATYSGEFGFGSVSGIDLPGETTGFIPTPQWKSRRFHERWVAGDTMNMSIGQGFMLVTPIQMTNMICMVVNGGKIYKPYILKEVRDPVTGTVEYKTESELLHQSSIDPKVFETVRRNMRGVITQGSARGPLMSVRTTVAGKTGTGEVGLQDHWHSWFAAFAPYETNRPEDRVAVSVIVEASNTWEWWAPYASAIIFQGIFEDQTYDEAVQSLGFGHLGPVWGRRE